MIQMPSGNRYLQEQIQDAAALLGNEAATELCSLYSSFDERLITWFAQLFDASLGGFYYSPSAKENNPFLPDIESTVQALRCLHALGLLGEQAKLSDALPHEIASAVTAFASSLQNAEDGYFYHPQWGKDITVSRRGRDLSWSVGILRDLGATPPYPSPLERAQTASSSTLPDYLCSRKAFTAYLDAFDDPQSRYYVRRSSYPMGNLLQSQMLQIQAAGDEYVSCMFDYLEARQLPNGLWEEETSYESINGLMKLSLVYDAAHRPIPRATEGFTRALQIVRSVKPPTACVLVYNPWVCVNAMLNTVRRTEGETPYARLLAQVRDVAPDVIRKTAQKRRVFAKDDGSYSYLPDRSSHRSQGALVAVEGTNEGDVNATSILTNGTLRSMCQALGIPIIRPYGPTDALAYLKQMKL